MKIVWTQGVETELSKDIVQNYKESLVMRRRLSTLLNDKIEENRKVQVSKTLYDSPNWVYQQADRVGYERCLREIIELLNEK